MKTGYWLVGCYKDKSPDKSRIFYENVIPKEDRKPMTPKVCFDFCKVQYGMDWDCSSRRKHMGYSGSFSRRHQNRKKPALKFWTLKRHVNRQAV